MCPLSCTFSPVPLNEPRSWFGGKNNFSYNILTTDSFVSSYWHFLANSWADFNILLGWSPLTTNIPESDFQKRKLQGKFISALFKKITLSKKELAMLQFDTKMKMVLNTHLLEHFPVIVLHAISAPVKVLKGWFLVFTLELIGCCWSVSFYPTAPLPHTPLFFSFLLSFFVVVDFKGSSSFMDMERTGRGQELCQ